MVIKMKYLLISSIIVFILIIAIMLYDMSHYKFTTYKLKTDKFKESRRFIFICDLHNKVYKDNNIDLLNKIRAQRPDAILVGGDLMVGNPLKSTKVARDFIDELTTIAKVYYSYGNHETKYTLQDKSFHEFILKSDVILLNNNSHTDKDFPITFHGLELSMDYYRRGKKTPLSKDILKSNVVDFNEHHYNILLAHNPVYFNEYAQLKPDLILSGHIHGGIIRLPFIGGVISPDLTIFPKFDAGKFTKNNTTMIISKGLGSHTIPIRFLNTPECIIIDIN